MNNAQTVMKHDMLKNKQTGEKTVNVNDYQIGGDHYRKDYQHWDMVIDSGMPYLLACATKYVTRWKDKNGVQDLQKSVHYIAKAQEHDIFMPVYTPLQIIWDSVRGKECRNTEMHKSLERFASQLDWQERCIFNDIVNGFYEEACAKINNLIHEETFAAEANSAYTNQG